MIKLHKSIMCRNFVNKTQVIFNVTKRRIKNKSIMSREIESMSPGRCRALLRAFCVRVQLVITPRRPTTPSVHPPTSIFSRKRSVAANEPLLFVRIFVADPQSFLVLHMQIPIARRIDYPRPDRDRARFTRCTGLLQPGQMGDSRLPTYL